MWENNLMDYFDIENIYSFRNSSVHASERQEKLSCDFIVCHIVIILKKYRIGTYMQEKKTWKY